VKKNDKEVTNSKTEKLIKEGVKICAEHTFLLFVSKKVGQFFFS
jgi:hypothetical protein